MVLPIGRCHLPWLATAFLTFKALVSSAEFLNHHSTVHLLAVPESNALLMLQVVSDIL